MKLDVLVMASSRPDLLKITMEKFKDYVECWGNTELRYLIHEDFVYPEMSKQTVKWAENFFDVVESSLPKIGVGYAMDKMFKLIESDYVFHMQDDWEFERPIELDRIIWTMEKHKKINCVTFNKYRNMKPQHAGDVFEDKEYDFDGQKLCIYPGWQFLPGVWRMETVRRKWKPRKIRPEGNWQNQFGDNNKRVGDLKHLEDNVGAYMYGGMGEYRYVRHIGTTWRMAEWQTKNNNYKPTGCRHWEFMSLKRDRAPWLGDMPARPLNRGVPLTREGRELLKDQPDYIKDMYK
jgi:hypothetical protein